MEPKDYRPMWKELGLNLEGHDQLLAILGKAYKDIYMSQENRPKAMQYFDFVISEAHGLRIKELMETKKKGNKVIGTFCVYVPEEMILAVGGTCVGLCAGAEIGIDEAEKVLPRNTCALIKSFMGFKLAGLCPYIQASDLVVGETTCDGKKKAYEILNDYKETYVVEIPQMKTQRDRTLWRGEVVQFKEKIEEISGKKITPENLRAGIKIANNKRRALQRLSALRKAVPVPISGLDGLLVNQIAFYDDPLRFTKSVNALCDELDERIKKGIGVTKNGIPRILISGSPMALPNWKIPFIVETSGAIVVAEESCVGERSTRDLVYETGNTLDGMIDAIVDRYFKIDCACFTPNVERTDHILDLAKEFKADGVIHYSIQFCTPYTVEAYKVEKAVQKAGIPFLKIETDYGM
ncbi:MAG TPA: double-cubane-cluster-containing anaerobic reductase, partial [Thermodesulfobacteriota bacterium]|nr:double-cubane-cluster-containing anaerobic reductase [Thermodesulfobacteriota bacterium]